MSTTEALNIIKTVCAQITVPSPGWEQRVQIHEAVSTIEAALQPPSPAAAAPTAVRSNPSV